jgi:hypothetical protein
MSRDVASVFEKQHAHVLRDIDTIRTNPELGWAFYLRDETRRRSRSASLSRPDLAPPIRPRRFHSKSTAPDIQSGIDVCNCRCLSVF